MMRALRASHGTRRNRGQCGRDSRRLYLRITEKNMDFLESAKKLADLVEAEASASKVPVTVCVMDIHGNVILKHRMTEAPAFSIEIAERKAYTSALIGVRTADLLPLVQPGQELFSLSFLAGGRFVAMGGGVPLTDDGKVFAGVGVSGGSTAAQDVAIVEAAVAKFNRQRLS
jgi:uncharacterized protein GlcG (DUF336 family)